MRYQEREGREGKDMVKGKRFRGREKEREYWKMKGRDAREGKARGR